MKLEKFREYINKKVELNLANRVQKHIDDIFDDLKRGQVTLNKAANRAESDYNSAKSKIRQAEKLIKQIEEQEKKSDEKEPKLQEFKRSIKSAIANHKRLLRQAVDAGRI
tara:strand:- start:2371 stop:2700 length:330 start_codon:yes stop_codon:yes gene_type:complete